MTKRPKTRSSKPVFRESTIRRLLKEASRKQNAGNDLKIVARMCEAITPNNSGSIIAAFDAMRPRIIKQVFSAIAKKNRAHFTKEPCQDMFIIMCNPRYSFKAPTRMKFGKHSGKRTDRLSRKKASLSRRIRPVNQSASTAHTVIG